VKPLKRSMKILLLICSISFLTACAPTVRPMQPIVEGPERIMDKNYEINKSKKAYVGEEIIKIKDYWIKKTTLRKVKALNNFTIDTAGGATFNGNKGDIYPIAGEITKHGEDFYVVDFAEISSKIGITNNGHWADFALPQRGFMSGKPKIKPEDNRFEFVKQTKVDSSQGFTNFEIIFNGTTKNSIKLLYREYTPENMARPAFYQNLSYPIDADIIRFKTIRIRVNEVTSESIFYTILEDGLN